jgi:hypothetical protein
LVRWRGSAHQSRAQDERTNEVAGDEPPDVPQQKSAGGVWDLYPCCANGGRRDQSGEYRSLHKRLPLHWSPTAGGAVDLIGSFTAWLKAQELGWVERKLLELARTNLRNVSHL